MRDIHKSTPAFKAIPVALGRNCPDSIQDHKDFRAYDWTGKTSRKFSSLATNTQISNAEMLIPVTLQDILPENKNQSESFVLAETIQNLIQSGFI